MKTIKVSDSTYNELASLFSGVARGGEDTPRRPTKKERIRAAIQRKRKNN